MELTLKILDSLLLVYDCAMYTDCPWRLMRTEIVAIVVMGNFPNHKAIARKSFLGAVVNQGEYEF